MRLGAAARSVVKHHAAWDASSIQIDPGVGHILVDRMVLANCVDPDLIDPRRAL